MNRDESLATLRTGEIWDVLVIGGGATGLGVAVDAASRGYRTALIEQHDFAKGTSSRSTKLVHGGVRYLRSGEVGLVKSALHERGLLEQNAPHLVRRQPFVIPAYHAFDAPFYGLGLKVYEWLSGSLSFGHSRIISVEETKRLLPTLATENLHGGVIYYDGQFDDARLALTLAYTATDLGAVVTNYVRAGQLIKKGGRVAGASAVEAETGDTFSIQARVTINATGIFTDEIRRMDSPAVSALMTVSSGVHLVLDRSFLPGDHALMIPKTSDGRVLFAVPWHGKVVVGTTDEPRNKPELEPKALESEIEFLLKHVSRYLDRVIQKSDVLSVFAGLRPLVMKGNKQATKSLSRDHVIEVSPNGLLTITGGKWTSYRKMAEDTIDSAAKLAGLPVKKCATEKLRLHAASIPSSPGGSSVYGTDQVKIDQLIQNDPLLGERIHPRLPYHRAEILFAVRNEMARTVEDVLARRTRALLLDARAASEAAPLVAEILARELIKPSGWQTEQVHEFCTLAENYVPQL